jgi:soluble lytic murein transglycosylase
MREGEAASAYALASQHFIAPEEDNYSDLEWLSGYIALTYLDDPARAKTHFTRFDAAVSSPISKGRAGYWLGRAEDALGNADAAMVAYEAGAQHQTSFYGLLSAERLGLPLDPDLAGGALFGDWQDSDLLTNDLIEAGLLLLGADQRGLAVLFFAQAAETLSAEEIGQLAALFMEMEEPFYAILIAKTAVRRGLMIHDAYFPIHPMAQMDLPVEPALALAIARQESEFRTDAGSSVGALGLMQLMPATAQEVAEGLGLPYSRARLTSDWGYNATLGSRYLAYLTEQFGDAPVMIAAGYNAGPSRPRAWMGERGDPRRGFGHDETIDVIDWIEHIPFRETRNYVMRVTEGIPVYRARLGGDIGPVRFTDLLIGTAPVVRPVARPDRTEPDAMIRPPVRRAGQIGPTAPNAPSGLRPIPRGGDN